MPARYILLWVDKPPADAKPDVQQSYWSLLHSIGTLKLAGGTSRVIREGVWLIERDSDVSFFAHVLAQAEDRGLSVHHQFLCSD
jgi:hypothetical protein